MADTDIGSLSPPAIAIALILASVVLIAAVKLIWGMVLWSKKTEFMVGGRWDGERIEVVEWAGGEGYVRAGGELWRARSNDALAPGDSVKVAKADGLELTVKRI